ncbi:thymidylate synthase [Roseovarius sp. SYSU LYC5161]|uniref:thymidylate synthase n=1 Tax=Roseovarius halophilus (ex Wu et al. 2025) TaxID=3376060 RepID=UPI00399A367F
MKHFVAGLMAAALLGGCGGGSNPFEEDPAEDAQQNGGDGGEQDNGDDGGDGTVTIDTSVSVPDGLAGNVSNVTFDAAAETLVVEGLNLDEVPFTAVYNRRPGLDREGYMAFTVQEDPLDRHYTAYAAQSNNSGSVRATTVGSPGPRNRFFEGGHFDRDGGFDRPEISPDSGMVSYAGDYVAVTNIGDINGPDLKEIPADVDVADELRVPQALTITGNIFVNADFADNSVEGNIFDRQLVETAQELPSVVLLATPIAGNGTFAGDVEYDIGDPRGETDGQFINVGSYGGVFGGPESDGVAGVVNLEQFDGSGDPLDLSNEREVGIFVLDQCGQAVSDPLCGAVNPDVNSP